MRRVSLLAAMSAALAIGVLVVAAVVAAGLTGRGAVLAPMVVSAIAVGAGLAVGWRPALAVSSGVTILAGLLVVGQPRQGLALVVVGGASVVSHEAARISIDLRRPARLGPAVLGRVVLRTFGLIGVGGVVALVAAGPGKGGGPVGWVPVALVTAAGPVALAGLAALGSARPARMLAGPDPAGTRPGLTALARWWVTRGRGARTALAVAACVVVLGPAVMGAAARQDISPTSGPTGPLSRAATDDVGPEVGAPATIGADDDRAPRQIGGGMVNLVLVVLACLVSVLLVAGLRRKQIPLNTEPVDLGPDDPELDLVAPSGAQLEEEAVILSEEVVADLVADITVDLRSEPDPGRAVRYAYARVEQRLAGLGVERRPSESEPELLARALGVLGDDGRALADLTGLFERARFSDHPVPESLRAVAIDALDQIRTRLEPVR